MKLMPRLLAGSLVTALFTGLAVLGGASVANAVAIPVPVLGECPVGFEASAIGGWDKREAISQGSPRVGEFPARKRLARFGEPCAYGGTLYMPWELTDQVVPMIDEDEDGADDELPAVGACVTPGSVPSFTNAVPWVSEVEQLCRSIAVVRYDAPVGYSGQVSVSVEQVSAVEVSVSVGSMPAGDIGPGHTVVTVICLKGDGSTVALSSVAVNATTASSTVSRTCVTGTAYAVVASFSGYNPGGGAPFVPARHGVVWSVEDIAAAEMPPVGYYGGTVAAEFDFFATSFGPGQTVPAPWLLRSNLICSSAYNGGVLTTHQIEVGYQTSGEFEAEPPVVVDGVATQWTTSGEFLIAGLGAIGCDYVERIENWVCGWPPPLKVFSCELHEWSGDRWRDNHEYSPLSPEDLLCESPGGSVVGFDPDCIDILFPPYVDPTDFGAVCGDAPTWAPPGWDVPQYVPSLIGFLGEWFAHYGRCLFVPEGGFDRHGLVAEAWEFTAGGEAAEVFDHIVAAMEVSGYCGVIAEGDIQGADFIIDTCAWSWAVPLRDFLFWAILLFGGFSILMFIVRVVLAVVGFSPMPMPLEDKDEGGPSFK